MAEVEGNCKDFAQLAIYIAHGWLFSSALCVVLQAKPNQPSTGSFTVSSTGTGFCPQFFIGGGGGWVMSGREERG